MSMTNCLVMPRTASDRGIWQDSAGIHVNMTEYVVVPMEVLLNPSARLRFLHDLAQFALSISWTDEKAVVNRYLKMNRDKQRELRNEARRLERFYAREKRDRQKRR